MANLPLNQPVPTKQATITIGPLHPGLYVFQLVVVDEANNVSQPARQTVLVKGPIVHPPPHGGGPLPQ
jgi:hypothetical protein